MLERLKSVKMAQSRIPAETAWFGSRNLVVISNRFLFTYQISSNYYVMSQPSKWLVFTIDRKIRRSKRSVKIIGFRRSVKSSKVIRSLLSTDKSKYKWLLTIRSFWAVIICRWEEIRFCQDFAKIIIIIKNTFSKSSKILELTWVAAFFFHLVIYHLEVLVAWDDAFDLFFHHSRIQEDHLRYLLLPRPFAFHPF